MCSTYAEDFYSHLRELDRSRKPWTLVDKPSPLSSVLSGQVFTRDCLNEKSFGIFDFSTRFDADEVEWFLNKTIADACEGNTCVHEAVLSQRIDNLTSILKLGGSSNVKNFTGKTPVHCACELVSETNLSKEILKLLLRHGGDLYQRDHAGVTPLQSINSSLYTTVVQDICSSDIKDMESFEKLHGIIQQEGPLKEFEQLCFQLFQTKPDPEYPNLSYQTLLFRACKEGWTDGVHFILSQIEGTPPTNKLTNETPLHAACEGNHYEIVKELVTKFPNLLMVPDHLPYRRWQPIHTACAFGASDRILEVLLVGTLCLMERYDMLIDTFVSMNFIDALGHTPLYIATKCGNISHVSLMMTPSLFHSLFQIVPTLYVVPSAKPWPSPIHCTIAHNRKKLLNKLIHVLPLNSKVLAYPSVFSMRHMLQHMHKDAENKPIIYPLLETTICESSDGGLYLTDVSTAIQSYTDVNTAKKNYKLFTNLKMSPVAMAAAMGNAKFVEMLLDKEVNDDDGLALRLALHLQYYDIARTIVSFNNSQSCSGSMKKLATFLLPSDMLNSFTEIHLEDNCLKSLPLAFFQLPKLTLLNVSNNNLVELPVDSSNEFQSGWKCIKLKMLCISYNKLKCLPAAIWSMHELKELQANNNCIIEIEPPATKLCGKPKSINVSHNELCNVPQHIFLAEKVNISYNKLEYLPDCIWTSKTLNNLNAANNQIKVLHFPVSPCSSNYRPLTTPTGERIFAPYKSENTLSSLNLSSNNLISFPKYLTCFAHNLQDLNISNNQISILCIYLLPPCLKYLFANSCSLENIKINCDEELFCPHKSHRSLESLAYLYLKGNKLRHFSFKSDSDSKMHCLIYPNLEELNLSNNMLYDQLDSNIGHQKHLNSLILSNNPNLLSLPLELSCLTSLRVLELNDLPCLTDPYLREYQSHQSFKELQKLISYMKSAMKSTVNYREVNLIIVGGPETGKTLLMKKLIYPKRQNLPKDEIAICIRKTRSNKGKVYLRIWDFPNHDNHTNAFYCFYSKQAIYLVVFKLTDGTNGIKGLDNHLRNIKAHAPGCPVMIIGTHCDAVNVKEDDISQNIHCMYHDNSFFPRIADVCCVSNIEGNMKALRKRICSVAWRLRYQKTNKLTLASETDSIKLSNDPSAVLKQYIPKSYLSLQNEINKKASSERKNKNLAPVMNKEEFYEYFYNQLALFEDEEEMVSAVEFLHCQSNLFHFEDQSLCSFYFLDLQWIFSTMINIMKITSSNGIVSNDQLIAQSTLTISRHLQAGFLALLAKFNFAISYKSDCLLVHTLLPKHLGYSVQPLIRINSASRRLEDTTANTESTANDQSEMFPKPKLVSSQEFDTTDLPFLPLRKIPSLKPKSLTQNLYRTWLASFIPDGFWPQLLTKVISDDSISSILSSILFIPLQNNRYSLSYANTGAPSLWKLHQKGFVIEYEKKKLLELREASYKIDNFANELNLSKKYASQVELVVYTSQIASLCKECQEDGLRHNPIKRASKLLVLIEQHILDIGEWFPDIFCDPQNGEVLSYVPCSLGILQEDECISCFDNSTDYRILCFGGFNVICFSLKDILEAYAKQSKYVSCPTHKRLSVQRLAPDVCFEDLDNAICNPEIPLIIDIQTELGRGGFAIVLRGKLDKRSEQALVAVKIIHDGLNQAKSLADFLSNYTASVKGYRLIRREINFLSTLHHDNLTPLCGAHINPFMLLMKLAPFGSLNTILKQYRDVNMVLDPAVVQASVYQVASAVDFLHQKHVLHCDLKSGNVLVWKFPLPRQQNAGKEVMLKITDYGISRTFSANNKIRYSSISGTPGFIAPEVYTGKYEDLQSNKIDVFAFGMFLYELITLLKPFELLPGSPELLVRKKERPQIPKENFTPCLFQHIMKVCWSHNPDNRPSMAQVVKWSQFPELQSLRTIHELELKRLSGICQCQVVRDHVHQHATVKPQNLQHVIPNCEKIQSLFSSLSSLTPQIKRRKPKSDKHTQIWIAQDKDEITTKLTIVTLRSSDLGYYVYEDTIAAKVVAMTNVRHHMWVYTNDQKLYVIQTAKMKTIACVMLKNTIFEVIQLLHVPEWHLVLVLWELSEIWCLYDETNASGLYQMGTWKLNANSPINSLCKVTFESTTEVWATRKDKEIVVLSRSPSGCCESNIIVCCTNRCGAHNCHLITCLQFNTDSGKSLTHVWVSFDGYPQLVCWDGPSKTQLHTISLQSEDEKCQSTSLLGHKNHLYVGTSSGKVEVYNSENGNFFQQFSWHSSKVNDLIELPLEIKQSICAESKTHQGKVHHYSLQSSISDTIEVNRAKSVRVHGSYMTNSKSGLYSVPVQSLPLNSPLIISFGDNLAEHLNIGDQNAQQKKIEFLMWTGCYTN